MTRDRALEISDALVAAGLTHTISVGVHDKFIPRERYSVAVTPLLAYSPLDITALQRLGDRLGSQIAYVQGTFTFTDAALEPNPPNPPIDLNDGFWTAEQTMAREG